MNSEECSYCQALGHDANHCPVRRQQIIDKINSITDEDLQLLVVDKEPLI